MEQEACFKIKQCRRLMVSPSAEKKVLLRNPMVTIRSREGKLQHLCIAKCVWGRKHSKLPLQWHDSARVTLIQI